MNVVLFIGLFIQFVVGGFDGSIASERVCDIIYLKPDSFVRPSYIHSSISFASFHLATQKHFSVSFPIHIGCVVSGHKPTKMPTSYANRGMHRRMDKRTDGHRQTVHLNEAKRIK